jgi:hypothetical protein
MAIYVPTSSTFPTEAAGRSRLEAAREIAEYAGGRDSDLQLARAKRNWDSAVRQFNRFLWNFNRVEQDITLVADTKTYALNTSFKAPFRGLLVNSDGDTVTRLGWIPYGEWLTFDPWNATGGAAPGRYTIRNEHNEGLVTFDPFPTGTLTYPTARIHYYKWIALATGDADKLNVPRDVDEAIFLLALANFLLKVDGKQAASIKRLYDEMFLDIEQAQRGFADHWSPYYD